MGLHPNQLGKAFVVHSDGSKVAFGGMLCQIVDGTLYVIEYASRMLKGSELNYGISDIECLTVVFLVRKWHHYLYGVHFTVYTDHKALLNLMNIRDYHGRLGRQAMFLQEYTFTIKYLPGKENSGADVASRPIFSVTLETKPVLSVQTRNRQQVMETLSINEKEGYKLIDPYEDINLLYFMKFNKQMDGISKSQVKRITRLSEKFRFKNDNETVEILKNEKWLTYPKLEDRKQIILKAHLLGHFENMATIERLKNRYYWRRMYQDVDYYIQRCLTCQRSKGMTPIEHSAKATIIEHIFQRICMDIVSGLPEDNEGYCKILVIVEYMTKLVTIFPLKTKSAENLWTWISRYGPPNTILSDQGKEFVNKTVEQLINRTGIERRVTSAYNPRTDGQCERMNQTVIIVLKKHAEAEPQNWRKWISYVEYVYNTRKNCTTGYSPYELLYGVQPNEFINYKEIENSSEELALLERSKQLKKLIESERQECLESISKAQEYQKKTQDKRNNPTSDDLEVGTKVMVKVEGLAGKLGQKYHGRYTIMGRTSGGNYKLKTANGTEVQQTYPISKLKPILEDEDKPEESFEVEKILEKRKNESTDKIEYLVKWKDLDNNENQWVPEENFDELQIVNDFNQRINSAPTEEQNSPIEPKRKRGRPRKFNIAATLVIIMMFILSASANDEKTIKQYDSRTLKDLVNTEIVEYNRVDSRKKHQYIKNTRYKRCDTDKTAKILKMDDNCKIQETKTSDTYKELDEWFENTLNMWIHSNDAKNNYELRFGNNPPLQTFTKNATAIKYETMMQVIAKQHEEVSGWAYECKFYKARAYLETTITGRRYPARIEKERIKPTRSLCWNLVNNNVCISTVLNCSKTSCTTQSPNFENDYSWWSIQEREYSDCSFDVRRINAINNSSEVYRSGCLPEHGECDMANSVIVWDTNEVIHKCPYEII